MKIQDPVTPVILVTGAARRIGAEIARLFHTKGYDVIVHYNRAAAEANQLCDTLNATRDGSCWLVQGDLNDSAGLQRIVALANTIGRLDVLINNASSFYPTPLADTNDQQWNDLINSNLRGPFFLSAELAPLLQSTQGAIINISDMHARQALQTHPIYTIAKAGNIAMTKSLALELAPHVRVNSVAPGAILWPEHEADDHSKQNAVLTNVPMGRLGRESDIAQCVYFLAAHASYVTGQTIAVDGGASTTL
ncbi:MAG TPA: pteridine reductase [Porticoccaceae bacterium]|nr:pteridine reductase [Porticoccaceae bacterium]|tara:strand:- start:2224 stop:2973 length:750 start_codon:yes stop_codon:yes gene_type:complete